tara:strand:- start:10 stop:186 length:177 start_codon:yes stop_codon:yes gene_type:complete
MNFYEGLKAISRSINNNPYYDVDPNIIRYFRNEYGKEWEHALTNYLNNKENQNDKKAA